MPILVCRENEIYVCCISLYVCTNSGSIVFSEDNFNINKFDELIEDHSRFSTCTLWANFEESYSVICHISLRSVFHVLLIEFEGYLASSQMFQPTQSSWLWECSSTKLILFSVDNPRVMHVHNFHCFYAFSRNIWKDKLMIRGTLNTFSRSAWTHLCNYLIQSTIVASTCKI